MKTRIAIAMVVLLAGVICPCALGQDEAPVEELMPAEEVEAVSPMLPPALIEEEDDEGDLSEMLPPAEPSELPEMEELLPAEPGPLAEETVAPEADIEAELIELEIDQEQAAGDLSVAETEAKDLITISLDDVPVQDVVRMFARISGVNIVAGTNLQGNVTVSLQEVEWEPALRVILDSVDMTMVEKTPGIYSIMSKSEMASEPVTVDTIFLSFTTVKEILPIVQKMMVATNASASAFPAANAIVVQETSAHLQDIKNTVERLDVPRPQVFIEAKFVELNDQAIENLGINWQVLSGYTVGLRAPSFTYARGRSKTQGTENRFSESATWDLLRQDSDVSEVVESELRQDAEGSISGNSDFFTLINGVPSIGFQESAFNASVQGRNFTAIDGNQGTITAEPVYESTDTRLRSVSETAADSLSASRAVSDDVLTTTEELLSAVLSADDFALTLSALKEHGGVDIISNPRIIVASGQTANIHVGVQEPNIQAKPQGDAGNVYVYGLDSAKPFFDIGVKVDVTPTVNTEDKITLRIEPELSRLGVPATVPQAGIEFPRIITRRITTEFNLESGRTVAIGGLTQTTDDEQVTKVPILGDVPIIGKYLFRHTSTQTVQDELVIFVTVGLAGAESLTEVAGVPTEGKLIHQHLARESIQAHQMKSGK